MKTTESSSPGSPLLRAPFAAALLRKRLAVWIIPYLATTLIASAQGSFQNLDFESPNVANLTNSFVAFGDAFPGWVGYIGTNQASTAGYNFTSAGSALATLITPSAFDGSGVHVIGGNYTATIAAGQGSISTIIASAAIAQAGLIPPSARSLTFSAAALYNNIGDFVVTFNGQPLPFVVVSSGSNYVGYGADISAFSGVAGELRFTASPLSRFDTTIFLDNIAFSDLAIPEPGTVALLGLGVLLLGCLKKKLKVEN